MKALLAAVGLGIALVVCSGLPALAAEPQENPDNAAVVYDGVSLLQKYSQVLDNVLTGDTTGVQLLQIQAASANFPSELENAVGSFFASAVSLSGLLPSLHKDLDDGKIFLSQYRIDDAKRVLDNTRQELTLAYSNLLSINISASDTGLWWKADNAPAGSTLRQVNAEVQARLLTLRDLLDQYEILQHSLALQDSQSTLPSTNLSLAVTPAAAFVGENVSFHGILGSGAIPLAGRKVTIVVDNSTAMTVITAAGGDFGGVVALPFHYSLNVSVQAVYSPEGDDVNRYMGCSAEVAVNVQFYKTLLNVAQGTAASPGRGFLVQGSFNYGNNTALPERLLNVYLDDNLIFNAAVGIVFALNLPVSANTSIGTHNLTFDVPGVGRYAPNLTSLDVAVSRIVPVLEVKTPQIILLPLSPQISGNVRSAIGPLANTTVEITLGNWKTVTRTGEDGSFSVKLGTGFSLAFLGTQDLRVTAVPSEAWYETSSSTVRVLVINPAYIAGIIILLAATVFGAQRLGKKPFRRAGAGRQSVPEPGPALVKPEIVPAPGAVWGTGDPRSIALSLYRAALRFVQQVAGAMLPPAQTLREFAAENAPKLGPAGGYFREFTLIIERLLYSRHDFDARDVAHARELSGKVLKGNGNEDT